MKELFLIVCKYLKKLIILVAILFILYVLFPKSDTTWVVKERGSCFQPPGSAPSSCLGIIVPSRCAIQNEELCFPCIRYCIGLVQPHSVIF